MEKTKYTHEEIKQFWVGLIDSDGSIQCNHWRKKSLQYRIVIKMHEANLDMLLLMKKHLGGKVRSYPKVQQVVWVENHQRGIWKLCEIFKKYPPLTTRVTLQLKFLLQCATHKDVSIMLSTRDQKYLDRPFIENEILLSSIAKPYFSIWCSGFITGKGCFCIRKNKVVSFSIGQNNDKYLLTAIRNYFESYNSVRALKSKPDFFMWEVYRRQVLLNIIEHCDRFPLLGYKKVQFDIWRKEAGF